MDDNTAPRIAPRFDVTLTLNVESKGVNQTGASCNISIGGLCANFNEPLPQGEQISLTLDLNYKEEKHSEFKASARVVWCTKISDVYQCGLQFLPLEEPQLELLGKFINAMKAKT